MFRTTNIGLAAWLIFRGLEPDWIERDQITDKLVLFFMPTSELSQTVHQYRFGDGPEESIVRKYNEIATKLTNKRPVAAGADHE